MQQDGATLRQHLQAVATKGGQVDERLGPPAIPSCVTYLWDTFMSLSSARRSGGFGASAIALTDMEAWARMNRVSFTPWEIDTILVMDATMLRVFNRKRPSA
jgi:hypothetical protein